MAISCKFHGSSITAESWLVFPARKSWLAKNKGDRAAGLFSRWGKNLQGLLGVGEPTFGTRYTSATLWSCVVCG